jgi:hypothetical protein
MLAVEEAIDQHSLFGITLPNDEGASGSSSSSHPVTVPRNPSRPTIISQIHDEVIYDVPLQSTHTAGKSAAAAAAAAATS